MMAVIAKCYIFLSALITGVHQRNALPLVKVESRCTDTDVGSATVTVLVDTGSYRTYAVCADDRHTDFTSYTGRDTLNVYFPGSAHDEGACVFNKRSHSRTYSVYIHVGLGEVGVEMTKQKYLVSCVYDPYSPSFSEVTKYTDVLAPGEDLYYNAGGNTRAGINLEVVDMKGRPCPYSIPLGKPIMLRATLIRPWAGETSFRVIGCRAFSVYGSFPILEAGCGDGQAIPTNRGFFTKGTRAISYPFLSFRLRGSYVIHYHCRFVMCMSPCDGNSCQTRTKRSINTDPYWWRAAFTFANQSEQTLKIAGQEKTSSPSPANNSHVNGSDTYISSEFSQEYQRVSSKGYLNDTSTSTGEGQVSTQGTVEFVNQNEVKNETISKFSSGRLSTMPNSTSGYVVDGENAYTVSNSMDVQKSKLTINNGTRRVAVNSRTSSGDGNALEARSKSQLGEAFGHNQSQPVGDETNTGSKSNEKKPITGINPDYSFNNTSVVNTGEKSDQSDTSAPNEVMSNAFINSGNVIDKYGLQNWFESRLDGDGDGEETNNASHTYIEDATNSKNTKYAGKVEVSARRNGDINSTSRDTFIADGGSSVSGLSEQKAGGKNRTNNGSYIDDGSVSMIDGGTKVGPSITPGNDGITFANNKYATAVSNSRFSRAVLQNKKSVITTPNGGTSSNSNKNMKKMKGRLLSPSVASQKGERHFENYTAGFEGETGSRLRDKLIGVTASTLFGLEGTTKKDKFNETRSSSFNGDYMNTFPEKLFKIIEEELGVGTNVASKTGYPMRGVSNVDSLGNSSINSTKSGKTRYESDAAIANKDTLVSETSAMQETGDKKRNNSVGGLNRELNKAIIFNETRGGDGNMSKDKAGTSSVAKQKNGNKTEGGSYADILNGGMNMSGNTATRKTSYVTREGNNRYITKNDTSTYFKATNNGSIDSATQHVWGNYDKNKTTDVYRPKGGHTDIGYRLPKFVPVIVVCCGLAVVFLLVFVIGRSRRSSERQYHAIDE